MPSLRIQVLSAAFHFQFGPEKLLNTTLTSVTGFPVNAVDDGFGEAEVLELAAGEAVSGFTSGRTKKPVLAVFLGAIESSISPIFKYRS